MPFRVQIQSDMRTRRNMARIERLIRQAVADAHWTVPDDGVELRRRPASATMRNDYGYVRVDAELTRHQADQFAAHLRGIMHHVVRVVGDDDPRRYGDLPPGEVWADNNTIVWNRPSLRLYNESTATGAGMHYASGPMWNNIYV